MSKVKIQSKVDKKFSLPKINTKILLNSKMEDFSRLKFPRKDDSSLIGGVGRKHFNNYNSSALQSIFNPEILEAPNSRLLTKQRLNTQIYSSYSPDVTQKIKKGESFVNKINQGEVLKKYQTLQLVQKPEQKRVLKSQLSQISQKYQTTPLKQNISIKLREPKQTNLQFRKFLTEQSDQPTPKIHFISPTKIVNPTFISSKF